MKYIKGDFVVVPNKHILKGQPPSVQSVFYWICSFIDEEGVCFPSIKKIADCAGVSERTVDAALKSLTDLGILEKINRFKGNEQVSNEYQVLIQIEEVALGGAKSALPPRATVADRTISPLINYKEDTLKEEKEEPVPTFKKFMADLGYTEDYMGEDGEGTAIQVWIRNGKVQANGTISSLYRQYVKKYQVATPVQRAQNGTGRTKNNKPSYVSKDPETPFSAKLSKILMGVKGMEGLDGRNNNESATALRVKLAADLKKRGLKEEELDDDEIVSQFKSFLAEVERKSPFHWKNMTSIEYINRNFYKILGDIT